MNIQEKFVECVQKFITKITDFSEIILQQHCYQNLFVVNYCAMTMFFQMCIHYLGIVIIIIVLTC